MAICIIDFQSTTAAGQNVEELRNAINQQKSGLCRNDLPDCDIDTWIGRVKGVEELDLGSWQSRNNALAATGLAQGTLRQKLDDLIVRFGASRIGIIMGSSTSSIDRTEQAYRHLDSERKLSEPFRQPEVHNPHAPGLFVAHFTSITGPTITINTACSSSAKVFASGARWLQQGFVDAVLVGGVDSLCNSVMHGFHSLQLVSAAPCQPFDQNRSGINLGEAAGFAILMRAEDSELSTGVCLAGYGESSDAHHMSHPHPQGLGARLAIEQAMSKASLGSADIDYINLHGTASRANDLIEGNLVSEMFPARTHVSSTKAWMGHTLGAAGITEALIAVDALLQNRVPGCLNLVQLDEQLELNIEAENRALEMQHVMSNSFGFGGNNCCLIFSREDQ